MQANFNFIFTDREKKKGEKIKIIVYTYKALEHFPVEVALLVIENIGYLLSLIFALHFSNLIHLGNTNF